MTDNVFKDAQLVLNLAEKDPTLKCLPKKYEEVLRYAKALVAIDNALIEAQESLNRSNDLHAIGWRMCINKVRNAIEESKSE